MSAAAWWPWIALALLGALHGVNPGMGWLFAVARGLQLEERRAVWRALLPLAVGHAAAIAVALVVAVLLGLVIPVALVRWGVVVALALLGLRQLLRHRHPRFGGMRIGNGALAVWSFLVASAHGAGLMAVPFAARAGVTGTPPVLHAALPAAQGRTNEVVAAIAPPSPHLHASAVHAPRPARHPAHAPTSGHHGMSVRAVTGGALVATVVHAVGYLLVTGGLAVVVYERAGTALLRRAWFNIDRLWAASLLLTALTLALAGGGA